MPELAVIADIENEKKIFKDLTHQLNNYNEIFNLNVYLSNTGNQERMRLEKMNETLKGKILKLKQEYVLQDRSISYMSLKNNLMYYSIIVIAIILILVGLYLKKVIELNILGIATGVISVFFILSVILVVKNNADRRNLVWDQYYWGAMKS